MRLLFWYITKVLSALASAWVSLGQDLGHRTQILKRKDLGLEKIFGLELGLGLE